MARADEMMRIRAAVVADLPSIEALVADAYGHYVDRLGKKPGPMLDDYSAHVRTGAAWVADVERAVAGLLVLLPGDDDALLLDNLAVSPAWQGRGLGRALLAFAEEQARRQDYRCLRLYTHERMTENIAMYRALGWQEMGRAEQAGYSRVFFRKPVGGPV